MSEWQPMDQADGNEGEEVSGCKHENATGVIVGIKIRASCSDCGLTWFGLMRPWVNPVGMVSKPPKWAIRAVGNNPPELKMYRCKLCGTKTHGDLFCSAAHSNQWHGNRRARNKK